MADEQRLRDFLSDRFPAFDESFSSSDDLSLVVDSLGLFDVLEFVEREFDISVPTEEFSPQKFASIDGILQLVGELKANG